MSQIEVFGNNINLVFLCLQNDRSRSRPDLFMNDGNGFGRHDSIKAQGLELVKLLRVSINFDSSSSC